MKMDNEKLHQILNTYFDQGEVNTLCFSLGIDYTKFTTQTLTERVTELVKIISEQGRTLQLVDLVRQQRPFLFSEKTQAKPVSSPASFPTAGEIKEMDRLDLHKLLITHLAYAEIQALCTDLGIDEKQLPGKGKPDKARELIIYLEAQERLPDLRERLAQHASGAHPLSQTAIEHSPPIPARPLPASIHKHFSEKEFEQLCYSLGVNIEDLVGVDKISSFIQYLERRNRIPELIRTLTRLKPQVPWQEYAGSTEAAPPVASSLEEQIAFHFNEEELATLCFDFGIDYEDLQGINHIQRVQSLISAFVSRNQMDRLFAYLNRACPSVPWQ